MSSYRHSIHDLTGRGRFTLFAWAALSEALMEGAEGVRGLEGAVSMSNSMAARGPWRWMQVEEKEVGKSGWN